MRKILLIAALSLSLPLMAQKTQKKQRAQKPQKSQVSQVPQAADTKYYASLSKYLRTDTQFLSANGLTSTQMKKMFFDTFKDKKNDEEFKNASDSYFSTVYEKDLNETLLPYFTKSISEPQLDSLTTFATADYIRRVASGLEQCADASYRDQKVDETLTLIAEKTGKKKKKKNMKKFVSDCTPEYRSVIQQYSLVANTGKLSEDWINAIYHTIDIEDLSAYNAYLTSASLASYHTAEAMVKDEIFTIRGTIVSKFQTWTYKAYPSIFTKKQTQPKKRRGKKNNDNTTQPQEIILEGGIIQ